MEILTKEKYAELDATARVRGWLELSNYDCKQIKTFGSFIKFDNCVFRDLHLFGEWCNFKNNCVLGDCCRFGDWNSFEDCIIGKCCHFGEHNCHFDNCKIENKYEIENYIVFTMRGMSSLIFYDCKEGIFVGRKHYYFFGTIAEFIKQLKREKGEELSLCLDVCNLAVKTFKNLKKND